MNRYKTVFRLHGKVKQIVETDAPNMEDALLQAKIMYPDLLEECSICIEPLNEGKRVMRTARQQQIFDALADVLGKVGAIQALALDESSRKTAKNAFADAEKILELLYKEFEVK